MIGSLRGVLVDKALRSDSLAELVVEAGGVGYRVLVPVGSAPKAEVGKPVFLWVHTYAREDALVLYGFAGREERDCFELLLGAHGVGPALAGAVLSALSPAALRRAVEGEDLEALALVPGIGKKTAARLVLELAPRFQATAVGLGAAEAGALAKDRGPAVEGREPAVSQQVREALSSLGYGPDEVRSVLNRVSPGATAEQVLREALRELAGSR